SCGNRLDRNTYFDWTCARYRGTSGTLPSYSYPSRRRSLMAREFTVVVERDDAGYLVATVPSLHGCHTQARTMDELLTRDREAVELCLEAAGDDAEQPLEFVGVQRMIV